MNDGTGEPLSIIEHFAILRDEREASGQRHSLTDILVITLCGIVCGVDNWVEMERFGRAKEAWFRTFLRLQHGIPSHDTMSRVVGMLDPTMFEKCFIGWVKSLARILPGAVVAVDGKTVRNSFDRATGKNAIHLVSAWATEAGLCLGQVKTSDKSNEITAIPELLKLLHLKGCIVTTDAMGCQKDIAKAIVKAGADYTLQVKDNQPTLRAEIEEYFGSMPSPDVVQMFKTVDKDHGRIEERTYWHTHDIDWFEDLGAWPGLSGFGMVERKRTLLLDDKTSTERAFFVTSFRRVDVARLARAVRLHWGVENGLHWSLDVVFDEDSGRARSGNVAQNLSLLRKIAINLLKAEKSVKVGVQTKRKMCGWDDTYLLKVLATGTP